MNSLVLAGVELGPSTIVGGGVVTKSFPDGCVFAGNSAKVIKYLDKDKVKLPSYRKNFYGYLLESEFDYKKSKYIEL